MIEIICLNASNVENLKLIDRYPTHSPQEVYMKLPFFACLIACVYLAPAVSAAAPASAYVGQEARDIKALSPEDVNAYLSGKGMGLARAAELNGYAGPAHVLELAAPLALTPEQRARTEALFASMTSKATPLGQALVAQERKLDRLFATKAVTAELLASSLHEIGLIQAKVRLAHLEAHLDQVEILSAEQNGRYAQLRGYGSSPDQTGHAGQRQH